MAPPAYSFVRRFDVEPRQRFCIDRHYLLCVSKGVLRLESAGTSWTLPPARAALIAAGNGVEVSIPQPVTSSSVLFAAEFAPPPPTALAVFDLTPLARALITECARWGEDEPALDGYSTAMFQALAACTWELARTPSAARMPAARSAELRQAIARTAATMADDPTIEHVAADVGLTSRSLARRFEDELGMTWRAVLRRLRVLRAIELLAEDESASVAAVAMGVGYSSLSAFNAAFHDLVGETPTHYRASFRPGRSTTSDSGDRAARRPPA